MSANHFCMITEPEMIDKLRFSVDAGAWVDARRGGAGACGNAGQAAAGRPGASSHSLGRIRGRRWGRKDEREANVHERSNLD